MVSVSTQDGTIQSDLPSGAEGGEGSADAGRQTTAAGEKGRKEGSVGATSMRMTGLVLRDDIEVGLWRRENEATWEEMERIGRPLYWKGFKGDW